MNDAALDPVACALFVVVAFTIAGCIQTVWLSTSLSRRLSWPLDGGLTFRGQPIFGANKTVRGLVVMIPATAAAFVVAALAAPAGIWRLSLLEFTILGGVAGAGFMLGELPNSFIKRQLHIAPGAAARGPITQPLFGIVDHVDSVIGALVAMALIVTIPLSTSIALVVGGWVLHRLFSGAMFLLGGKERAA